MTEEGSQGQQNSVPWGVDQAEPTLLLALHHLAPPRSALLVEAPKKGTSPTWTSDSEFPVLSTESSWAVGRTGRWWPWQRRQTCLPHSSWPWVSICRMRHACRPPARWGGWIPSGILVVNQFWSPKQKWCDRNGTFRKSSDPQDCGVRSPQTPLLSQGRRFQGVLPTHPVHGTGRGSAGFH